jgi:hypothetical protein
MVTSLRSPVSIGIEVQAELRLGYREDDISKGDRWPVRRRAGLTDAIALEG